MTMEYLLDTEPFATDRHELDTATCVWLLSTERVGRFVVLEPRRAFVAVSFLVAGGAILVRVEPGSDRSGYFVGAPVALDVDVFDRYSQTGWSVHVRGVVELVLDGPRSDEEVEPRLPEWMRHAGELWLRLCALDVTGRWFRAPDHPPVLAGGHL
jgi:Pyridoxamine 5'-phosphate oxidase